MSIFYLAAREFVYNHYHYKIPNRLLWLVIRASCAWALARYISTTRSLILRQKTSLSEVAFTRISVLMICLKLVILYMLPAFYNLVLNYYEVNLGFTKIFKGKLEGFPEFCDGSLPVREVTPILGTI